MESFWLGVEKKQRFYRRNLKRFKIDIMAQGELLKSHKKGNTDSGSIEIF